MLKLSPYDSAVSIMPTATAIRSMRPLFVEPLMIRMLNTHRRRAEWCAATPQAVLCRVCKTELIDASKDYDVVLP